MNDEEAAELCAILKPRYAIPSHYAFTGGPIQDHLLLKYSGTAEEFVTAVSRRAPQTIARILPPGEPLVIPA
jgi:L-ascorbate metabolism protein UlaG (beta-lactamase superfamily)